MSDLDLRPLLRPGARGDAIPLFGVLIAGPAAPLRSVAWTDAESDRAEGEERAYRGGRRFRVLPTGEMEELLLEDSIEQTIAATGFLRLDGSQVCARIERGTLARVFVRGARLDALALRSEADIVARFGVAEGLERELGKVTYHYPSRALSITWSATDHQIVNVCLGGTPWEEPTLAWPRRRRWESRGQYFAERRLAAICPLDPSFMFLIPLVIERDGGHGATAQYKKVFKVDLSRIFSREMLHAGMSWRTSNQAIA